MEAVDSTSVTCESTSELEEVGQIFKEDVVESTTDRNFPPPPLMYDVQEGEEDNRNEAQLSTDTSRLWSKTEGETSNVGSRTNSVSDDCVTSVESNSAYVRKTETLHKYASDADEVMTTFSDDWMTQRCSQEASETTKVRYEHSLLAASSDKETVAKGRCDSEQPHNHIEIEKSDVTGRESVSETSSSINDNKVSSNEEIGEPVGQDQQISSSYSNVATDGASVDKGVAKEPSSSTASISSSTPIILEPTGSDHSVDQEHNNDLEKNGDEDQFSKQAKGLVLDDVEEGELDYEEEGEVADEDINLSQSSVALTPCLSEKNEALAAKDYDSGSEEGEIVSEDEGQSKGDGDDEDGEIKDEDDREEGEIDELPEKGHRPRTLCRYFNAGTCRWGITCRFLHPGVNDKGNYLMLRPPGMYPTAFGKPPPPSECLVGPSPMAASTSPSGAKSSHGIPAMPGTPSASGPGQAEMEAKQTASPFDFEPIPAAEDEPLEVRPPLPSPRKETAWERGLKRAKEIKQAALKRREQGETVEEKKGKDFPERKPRVSPERRRPDELRPKQPPGAYDERRFRRTPPFHYRAEREGRGDGRYDSRFDGRGEGRPDRMDRDRFQYRGQRRTPTPPARKYKGRDDRSDVRRERHHSASMNPERLPTSPVKVVPPPQQQQVPAPPASKRREPRDMRPGKEPVEPMRPKLVKEIPEPPVPDTTGPRDPHPMARMVAAEQWRDPWMRTQPPQPKAKSPDLPPLERSGSHSSISSSDSSDSESDSESGSEDTGSSESDSDSSLSSVEPETQVEAVNELPAERGAREPLPKSDASKRPPPRLDQVPSPLGSKSNLPYGPVKREPRVDRGERRERDRHSRRDEGSRGSVDDRGRPRTGDFERDFGKPPYGAGDRRRPSSLNEANSFPNRQDQGHPLTSGQAMNENWHKVGYNQQMPDGYMGNQHQARMTENPARGGNMSGSRVSPLLPVRNVDRRSPTSGWQYPSRTSPKVRSPRRSSPRRGPRPVSPPKNSPRRASPKRGNSPRLPIQRRTSPRTESPSQGRKGPMSREERPSNLDRSRIPEASRPLVQKRPLPGERGPKMPVQEVRNQAENEEDDDDDSDSSYGSPVAPLGRGPEPISNSESDSDSGSESESGTGSESESEHSNTDSDDSDSDSESENELERKKVPAVDPTVRDPRRAVPLDKFAPMKASEMAVRDQKSRLVGSIPDTSSGKAQAGMKRPAPDQNSTATTSKKEALLRELRAVESAIARKRAKVD